MPLIAGSRLGPYEIIAPAGAGGMGEVYRARDTRLNRTVALKILPPEIAAEPQARERFEREARAVAALNHPHIGALYDIGRQGDSSTGSEQAVDYLVLEFVEGETLKARLARGALPLELTLKTAIEIASALDRAHRAGLVHRDIKPGNIMLPRGGAKLLDFGLAKACAPVLEPEMAEHRATDLTERGLVLGTVQYMAPEQLECRTVDARADLFAFGAVLYEMLTGRVAFESSSQASVMAAILERDPPRLATLQPLVPAALDRLVATCLAKDPDDRWQTARDLLRELQWIRESEASSTRVLPGPVRTRSGLWPVAAGVLLLALVGLSLWSWSRWPTRVGGPGIGRSLLYLPGTWERVCAPGRLGSGAAVRHLARRASARLYRNREPARDALDSAPRRVARAGSGGHRGRGLPVLVPRQPVHRLLWPGRVESRLRGRRHAVAARGGAARHPGRILGTRWLDLGEPLAEWRPVARLIERRNPTRVVGRPGVGRNVAPLAAVSAGRSAFHVRPAPHRSKQERRLPRAVGRRRTDTTGRRGADPGRGGRAPAVPARANLVRAGAGYHESTA